MNIATDTAARKPFFQNSCDILNILPVHVKKWRSKTLGLTPAAKGAAFELWCAAFEHEGKLQDDDNFLARIVGTTKAAWLKIKPALRHLFQKVGDLLLFPELIEEISRMFSKREEKVSAANARWQKNTPRMGQNNKARKPKKSNEINEDLMQTHCGCNATSEHIESSLRSDSVESDKSDSRHPQAADQPDDPFDPKQWQAEKMAGAGSSESAVGADAPQPASAAPDGADPKKNSAQRKGNGRRVDLDNPRCHGTSQRQEAGVGYPAEFEAFWQTCPYRLGGRGGKLKPYQIWKKLSVSERAAALVGAQIWRKRTGGVKSEFTPMVSTWMNGRRWETESEAVDDLPPEPKYFHDAYAQFEGCEA